MNAIADFRRSAWAWLQRELDAWSGEGKTLNLWWRDDDAMDVSARLDRLLAISHDRGIALSLAVIPAGFKPGLATRLGDDSSISVLQHGYAHSNHAPPGEKKRELSLHYPTARLESELKRGFQLLEQGFGERFCPVLVPPWNRLDAALMPMLSRIGFDGISTMQPRQSARPLAGLLQVNAHLDPIHWRQRGGFVGTYPAIAMLIQHLQAKRCGYRDSEEPSGILTHHLVQNPATWRFIEQLFDCLCQHAAVRWQGAAQIWGQQSSQ